MKLALFGRGRNGAPKPAAAAAEEESQAEDTEAETEAEETAAETTEAEDTTTEPAAEEAAAEEGAAEEVQDPEEEEEDDMAAATAAEGRLTSALAALPKAQRGAARNIAGLAVTAAESRMGAILRSDEAKGRGDAALTMALEGGMSAGATVKVLGSLPKGGAKGKLAGAMAGTKHPDLGPGGKSAGNGDEITQAANRLLRHSRGRKK